MDENKNPNAEDLPENDPSSQGNAPQDDARQNDARQDDAPREEESTRDRFRRLSSMNEANEAGLEDINPDEFELPNRWQAEDFADPSTPLVSPPEKTLAGDPVANLNDTETMAADIDIQPVPVEQAPSGTDPKPGQMPWLESVPRPDRSDEPDVNLEHTAAQVGPSQGFPTDTQPSAASNIEDNEDMAATISQEVYKERQSELELTPPPALGDMPVDQPKPRVDASGMPLPPKILETDMGATQVSDSAFTPPPRKPAASTSQQAAVPRPPKPAPPSPQYAGNVPPAKPAKPRRRWRPMGCFIRLALVGMVFSILSVAGVATWGVMKYRQMVSDLPSVEALRDQASQFETTRILDRNGDLLYEILDPNAGRRTYVELEGVSPYMIAAIISTEDEDFYTHPGINIWAIARAFYQNYTEGEIVSGASTITQQLARALVLGSDEAYEQSYDRKLREALIAIEITRQYSRDEILELYLNEFYFGNRAYGIEAASQTYFTTTADKLTLAQASFLAGLLQAPSVYDVYTNPEAVFARQVDVLRLMYESSEEQDCIYVSITTERVCIAVDAAAAAAHELKEFDFPETDIDIRYPHWVNYVRLLLEEQYDPQTIYRSGFIVETSLDPALQNLAQTAVSNHIASLSDRNIQSGALIAINPQTGEILAMIGSADYYNEAIAGQINMSISPRQPGSSIKPLTYLAAFENGWTPATLIWDVESEFPPSGNADDTREPYIPVNYDGRYHGPVPLRTALGNSFNVPAVKALDFVGVYNEGGLIDIAQRLGLDTFTEDYYGLSLTLGGGEVTLLQLTGAYATFANQGVHIPPVAILRITDSQGNLIYEYEPPQGEQVISREHAYLISDILSDNDARLPSYGPNNVLNTAFPAAAKTGTTNDFRDNWTMGYTPEIAVGVWVGNPDFTEMINSTGTTGAAPIWAEFIALAVEQYSGGQHIPFTRPDGIVELEVCATSGTMPSEWCEKTKRELFSVDTLPPPAEEDLWQMVLIDTWTGLRASPDCSEFADDQFSLNVSDPWGREWLLENATGKAWLKSVGFDKKVFFAPERECTGSDDQPALKFVGLEEGDVIDKEKLKVTIIADGQNLASVTLYGAPGKSPEERHFDNLWDANHTVPDPTEVLTINLDYELNGWITLWLVMRNEEGGYAERRVHVKVDIPEPTETPTPTMTHTPLPTSTPTMTNTPEPTSTPTQTPSPTNTLVPPTANMTETVEAGLTGTAAVPTPTP